MAENNNQKPFVYNDQPTIGRQDRMANIMYTSYYEGRFCTLGIIHLSFYIHKQTNFRSDRIANIIRPHITPNVLGGETQIILTLFTIIS